MKSITANLFCVGITLAMLSIWWSTHKAAYNKGYQQGYTHGYKKGRDDAALSMQNPNVDIEGPGSTKATRAVVEDVEIRQQLAAVKEQLAQARAELAKQRASACVNLPAKPDPPLSSSECIMRSDGVDHQANFQLKGVTCQPQR